MAEAIYYCEVLDDYTWEFPKGILAIPFGGSFRGYQTKITRCISYSHRVWVQESHGRVKIIKNKFNNDFGYVTENKEIMKQFMWVKLKARTVEDYI